MHNLLNSTDIAILFLDVELKVRRFTNQVTNIIKLIPSDIGRQITDLVSELEYPTLMIDVREVLRTLVFKETEVPTHDDRWFIVKIMPYRTLENRIEGVVITFTNITISKKLELELQKTKLDLENLLTTQMVTYQLKSITDKTSGED
jgi:two-component system CheB/CheR fusion protein